MTEIDPHHEAPKLVESRPTQLGTSRPYRLSRRGTKAGKSTRKLSKVIELSPADDRLELAQQVSRVVVLAHA
ncbi:MAG: hypothetical protein ACJ780_00645 [Solirubrobacteraceae bacterium]